MPRLIAAKTYWTLKNKIRAIKSSISSTAFNLSFRTTGCFVHFNCEIYGVDAISVGINFKSREGLWLHAISTYETQSFRPKIVIGNNVALSKNVHIASIASIRIDDDVLIGSNVLITDHNHGHYRSDDNQSLTNSTPSEKPRLRQLSGSNVVIERNVFIGDGCIILPGSYICEGSIIGSGSVVNGYIERESIAAGRPAKVIKCYNHLKRSWEGKT